MHILARTVPGLEDHTVDELQDITDADITYIQPGRVLIDGTEQDLYRMTYLSGTCTRFIEVLADFTLEQPQDAYDALEGQVDDLMAEGETFAVRVDRHGDHAFSSPDIAREAGQKIVELYEDQTGRTPDVDLDDPDVVFHLDLFDDDAYLGVDTTGQSLDQRPYLRNRGEDITRPVLANLLVRASTWQPGDSLLDPFCRGGTIPIEAGRIECSIPNASRKFAFMDIERYSTDEYAAVVQEAKDDMDIHDLAIEGSGEHLDRAEMSAKASGLELTFRDVPAKDRDLDADHLVFHAPFIQQRSRRKEIADVMEGLEDRITDQAIPSTCLTQDREYFSNHDSETEVAFGSLEGWVVRWD